MKYLFENWRNYLNEGMKTVDDIGKVILQPPKDDDDHGRILIYDTSPEDEYGYSRRVGQVYFALAHEDDIEGSPCWDSQYRIYKINNVSAVHGYGPVLYDLVMEYAYLTGADGVGSSPKFGIANFSDAAAAVWEKYHSRTDVFKEYLPACKTYIFFKKSPDLLKQLKKAVKLVVKRI